VDLLPAGDTVEDTDERTQQQLVPSKTSVLIEPVEFVALRLQVLVLQRSGRAHKLRLRAADRLLWVWLSRLWSGWRSALVIVKPETVIAWHRRGFRLYWSWKSRHPLGRPSVSWEVIDLIRKMSVANPRWGAPRIHGELWKLGFELSEATVAQYMVRSRKPPSQT
jgi:putative transposase